MLLTAVLTIADGHGDSLLESRRWIGGVIRILTYSGSGIDELAKQGGAGGGNI